jgi:2-iminobutanoate/2-iminopropanoate deaminase
MSVANSWLVRAGDLYFFGGTAALGRDGLLVAPGDVAAQTRAIIERFDEALRDEGLNLAHLAQVSVYLSSLEAYPLMNAVYEKLIPRPYPARKVMQEQPMALGGMVVEMSAIASRHQPKALG